MLTYNIATCRLTVAVAMAITVAYTVKCSPWHADAAATNVGRTTSDDGNNGAVLAGVLVPVLFVVLVIVVIMILVIAYQYTR